MQWCISEINIFFNRRFISEIKFPIIIINIGTGYSFISTGKYF